MTEQRSGGGGRHDLLVRGLLLHRQMPIFLQQYFEHGVVRYVLASFDKIFTLPFEHSWSMQF